MKRTMITIHLVMTVTILSTTEVLPAVESTFIKNENVKSESDNGNANNNYGKGDSLKSMNNNKKFDSPFLLDFVDDLDSMSFFRSKEDPQRRGYGPVGSSRQTKRSPVDGDDEWKKMMSSDDDRTGIIGNKSGHGSSQTPRRNSANEGKGKGVESRNTNIRPVRETTITNKSNNMGNFLGQSRFYANRCNSAQRGASQAMRKREATNRSSEKITSYSSFHDFYPLGVPNSWRSIGWTRFLHGEPISSKEIKVESGHRGKSLTSTKFNLVKGEVDNNNRDQESSISFSSDSGVHLSDASLRNRLKSDERRRRLSLLRSWVIFVGQRRQKGGMNRHDLGVHDLLLEEKSSLLPFRSSNFVFEGVFTPYVEAKRLFNNLFNLFKICPFSFQHEKTHFDRFFTSVKPDTVYDLTTNNYKNDNMSVLETELVFNRRSNGDDYETLKRAAPIKRTNRSVKDKNQIEYLQSNENSSLSFMYRPNIRIKKDGSKNFTAVPGDRTITAKNLQNITENVNDFVRNRNFETETIANSTTGLNSSINHTNATLNNLFHEEKINENGSYHGKQKENATSNANSGFGVNENSITTLNSSNSNADEKLNDHHYKDRFNENDNDHSQNVHNTAFFLGVTDNSTTRLNALDNNADEKRNYRSYENKANESDASHGEQINNATSSISNTTFGLETPDNGTVRLNSSDGNGNEKLGTRPYEDKVNKNYGGHGEHNENTTTSIRNTTVTLETTNSSTIRLNDNIIDANEKLGNRYYEDKVNVINRDFVQKSDVPSSSGEIKPTVEMTSTITTKSNADYKVRPTYLRFCTITLVFLFH